MLAYLEVSPTLFNAYFQVSKQTVVDLICCLLLASSVHYSYFSRVADLTIGAAGVHTSEDADEFKQGGWATACCSQFRGKSSSSFELILPIVSVSIWQKWAECQLNLWFVSSDATTNRWIRPIGDCK